MIRIALRAEAHAHELYRRAASRTNDSVLRATYEFLANLEGDHERKLLAKLEEAEA